MTPAIRSTPVLLETHEADGAERCGMVATEPVLSGGGDGRVDHPEAGRWLLLREAVREIGSLEHLYRLAQRGKLQSRDDSDGQIEVWVTDQDGFDETPTRFLEGTRPAELVVPEALDPSEVSRQVVELIAPLVESHERQLQLARENGVLSERLVGLERELQVLREQVLRGTEGPHERTPRPAAVSPQPTLEQSRPWVSIVADVAILLGIIVVLLALSVGWIAHRPF